MKFIVNQIIPNKTPGDRENEEIACTTQYYNTVYTILLFNWCCGNKLLVYSISIEMYFFPSSKIICRCHPMAKKGANKCTSILKKVI